MSIPSVSTFPEEYIKLLVRASEGEVKFAMRYGDAVHYRQQLYRLRTGMRKEKHPYLNQAESVVIKINPEKGVTTDTQVQMIITPKSDNPFVQQIKETVGEVDLGEITQSNFTQELGQLVKDFSINTEEEEETDLRGILAYGGDDEEGEEK